MTFARFLQQYEATGREKGDGYDPSMFGGMTAAELERARAMLLDRALAGDTVDLAGLRWVGDEAVVAALRGASGHRADWDMGRIETLFALTGDAAAIRPLLDYVDGADAAERVRGARVLAGLPLPAGLARPLADRLCRAWRRDVVLPLAQAWLATQGLGVTDPAEFQARLPLIRLIVHAWPWRRRRVLARIASVRAP